MKLRRFLPEGIEAVRRALPEIEKTGDISIATSLAGDDNLTEPIEELDDIELDAERVFPTTYAFCEYFHSLIKNYNPLKYRADSGFWTWLAMVYLDQLVKNRAKGIVTGEETRIVLSTVGFTNPRRHLLATPFYFFGLYKDKELVITPLSHPMNTPGDLFEFVIGNQRISRSPVYLTVVRRLYFNQVDGTVKRNVGGAKAAGGIRRLIEMTDQFGMTRDFYASEDAENFIALLPEEFDKFKN